MSALVPLPGGTGSPQSLIGYGGYLATGLSSDAPAAARAFLSSKAALFRLTTAQVAALPLPLLNDQRMAGNTGHAVLFRQKFGTLTSPIDGMVTVGVTGGKVAYVSSSLAPTTSVPGGASMPDDESGSRFTALRQFQLDVCTQTVTNTCLAAAANGTQGWALHYTSPEDAFPGVLARRLAPDLLLRTFDVTDTSATHVRLVALQNQCTGAPAYQGEQDNDPVNNTDCDKGSTRGTQVRASELQVFSYDSVVRPPGDPVVITTMAAPATATSGSTVDYAITYTNLGPKASALAKITDALPAGLSFVSATNGGTYNASIRTVTWNLGTVAVNGTGTVHLLAKVTAGVGTTIVNQANFTGVDTIGLPSLAATLVVP